MCKQQSPCCETNRFSARQDFSQSVMNPEGTLPFQKSTPIVPIPSHINPVHYPFRRAHQLSLSRAISIRSTLPSYFLKTHFKIILATTPKSFRWSLSLRFPYQNPVNISLIHHTCHMPSLSHTHIFDHPSGIS